MNPEEYKKIAYGEWWEQVSEEDAKTAHAQNIENCLSALNEFRSGPIKIFVVHGSGRSNTTLSCAHEFSNSQMLLRKGLEILDEMDVDYEIDEVNLREYKIEPCNCCYSTTSTLCGFPCNCFPIDPMQELYPKLLRADVLLCSTGVNQSAMASRLKMFCDRLISLDGGFFVREDQFVLKDSDWRARCIALAQELGEDLPFDQRMQGRVAGFVISSKDNADREPTDDPTYDAIYATTGYADIVAKSLFLGFHDFGFHFPQPPNPWSVFHEADYTKELSEDKAGLNADVETQEYAKTLVRACVELAQQFRLTPPPPRLRKKGRT